MRGSGLLIVLTLFVAARADAGERAAAGAHFREGSSLYAGGHWADALAGFEAGSEAYPLRGFLVNIGQCYRKLDRFDEAADAWKRFLATHPADEKLRAEVEDALAEVETARAKTMVEAGPPSRWCRSRSRAGPHRRRCAGPRAGDRNLGAAAAAGGEAEVEALGVGAGRSGGGGRGGGRGRGRRGGVAGLAAARRLARAARRPAMKAPLARVFLLMAGCSRPTEVRLRLSLDANAPVPDAITVSLFDRFGGIAYDVPLAARLPGDLVVLVSSDAEMLRAVASGLSAGQVVVGGGVGGGGGARSRGLDPGAHAQRHHARRLRRRRRARRGGRLPDGARSRAEPPRRLQRFAGRRARSRHGPSRRRLRRPSVTTWGAPLVAASCGDGVGAVGRGMRRRQRQQRRSRRARELHVAVSEARELRQHPALSGASAWHADRSRHRPLLRRLAGPAQLGDGGAALRSRAAATLAVVTSAAEERAGASGVGRIRSAGSASRWITARRCAITG